ncbi:MAG: TolC family protein [Gammaproteobacteria bacterium HGW-Gammaproteobacteria-3]|nr:MAG: TolC family protein [Gammaproteobacteria bacterium HGW-Gammaproteobacteria-3]
MKSNYFPARLLLVSILNLPTSAFATEASANQADAALSSAQLVADVLAANPQLEVVRAIWQASVQRIEQQSALDDPILAYGLAPQTVGNSETDLGQRFEISQKIPWPGKLRLREEAASHEAAAASENIAALKLFISATTKTLVADWYYIHRAIGINKINQALLSEFRNIAISRYGIGLASKQDALSAEVEIALFEHQAIVLDRERRSILAHINTLLNRPPDAPLPPPSKLFEIKSLPEVKSLYDSALQSRPELKELAARIQSNRTKTELATREYYPDFNLTAGYNSLWDNNNKRFTVGVGINLPLDRGKRQAAENEARAKMKQAQWLSIDKMAKIRKEVQIAYDRTDESIHVFQLYQNKLLPLADENLEAAKADYRAGKGDFLTLISSEKNRMQTQLQTEQALADTHRHLAELERAVGSVEPLSVVDRTEASD